MPALFLAEYLRQPLRLLGALKCVDPIDRLRKNPFLEEEDRSQRLVLGGCRATAISSQVGQELSDFGLAHLLRVSLPVEEDEPPVPVKVCFLCPERQVPASDFVPELVKKLWLEKGSRIFVRAHRFSCLIRRKCRDHLAESERYLMAYGIGQRKCGKTKQQLIRPIGVRCQS